MKTHIFFDFDGTLVDSAPAILSCFAQVLKVHQLPVCRAIDSSLIGPPLQQTLAALTGQTDPALLATLAASFKELYDTEVCVQTPAYAGCEQVLKALRAQGYILAIATNKRLVPTQRILKALGWDTLFTEVFASDSYPQRYSDKRGMIGALLEDFSIETGSALYVGDTEADGLAAALNALDFWPVAWGYGCFAEHKRALSSIHNLLERLEQV